MRLLPWFGRTPADAVDAARMLRKDAETEGRLRNARGQRSSVARRATKRAVDAATASGLLVVASPLMAAIAVAIRIDSRGPVLLRQPRLGRDGSIFTMVKFRTMVDRAWTIGRGLRVSQDDDRITRVGRILRALHLDELPQLINVALGDMSLVGPRPTLPFHYDFYEEWEKERLRVLPGITGWAQVNGANALNWDRRIELDVWYVRNWSLRLDFIVLARTAWHVVARAFGRSDTYAPPGLVLWDRGFPDDPFTNSLDSK